MDYPIQPIFFSHNFLVSFSFFSHGTIYLSRSHETVIIDHDIDQPFSDLHYQGDQTLSITTYSSTSVVSWIVFEFRYEESSWSECFALLERNTGAGCCLVTSKLYCVLVLGYMVICLMMKVYILLSYKLIMCIKV